MYNALPPRFSSSYPRRNVEIFVRLENRRTEKNVLPRRKFRKIKKREKYWSKSPGGYRENRPVNLNSNASLAVCTRTRTALGRTYVSHKQKKPKKKKKDHQSRPIIEELFDTAPGFVPRSMRVSAIGGPNASGPSSIKQKSIRVYGINEIFT